MPVDASRLAALGMAEDREYRDALIAYLKAGRPNDVAELFRHPSLRRRTLAAIGKLMRYIDKHGDRYGAHPEVREMWRTVRERAKQERAHILGMLDVDVGPASPRRRAYHRLAGEFPRDWEKLIEERGPRVSLRRLVQLTPDHAKRYLQLLREERERDQGVDAAVG